MTRTYRLLLLWCVVLWASALSAQPHWTCNYRQYQNDMTVYFMLKNGDAAITALDNYEVAAFVGDECRGVATFETQTGTNGVELTYGFMKVYSNKVGDETVTVKYYDKAAAKEHNIRDVALAFVSNTNIGYPSAPVDFPLEFDVAIGSANTVMGVVSEGGTYKSGTLVTATATPNTGYKFVSWSDGVTSNPYTFKLVSDTLLTAQFALQQFTVTFIADGVTVSSEALDYGAAITPPTAPENGYTFVGWTPTPTTVPAEDITFTAQYERSDRVATFVVDGVVTSMDTVKFENPLTRPADPVKPGYTFKGWSPEVPATMPNQDVTYTAQFTINSHQLTWKVDTTEVTGIVEYATKLTIPDNPLKEGFTFKGWVPEVIDSMPDHDLIYTAQFDINRYQLTFIVDSVAVVSDSLDYATAIVQPSTPVKEGYTFLGWFPAVDGNMPARDVVYTAQFAINQYTVTFVLGNGESNVVKTQDFATDLTAPADPVKKGFTFKGWSTAIPATVPACDTTFTAQWDCNKYKLTWIVDGQKSESDVDYEAAITKPADPQKEGYTFTGWDKEVAVTMPDSALTYTAQFAINQYTVTFVFGNGESNVVKTQDYATDLTVPADPVKKGFTFKGWSTAIPATVPARDTTFTAQWDRNKYKLTWIVDGQKSESDVDYEAAITKPANPQKEGYTFTGWDKDVAATMPDSALTYTAQFAINYYAVIYMVGGKEWARDSLAYGTTIVKKNYTPGVDETFDGWTSDAEYTTMPAHDVTFTASITSGISVVGGNSGCVDVYTIDGSLVKRSVPVSELRKTLQRGLYVIRSAEGGLQKKLLVR